MLNKKEFVLIKKEMDSYEKSREKLIRKSRDIISLSKQVINLCHRDDMKEAGRLVKKIKIEIKNLDKIIKKQPGLFYSGSAKVAMQEFVEAVCYHGFLKNKKIPTHKELGVSAEYYLLGICDLTGELVRKAINTAIKGNFKNAIAIKDFVSDIYAELLKFRFRNELRKKFDSIKYDLKKLEDLALNIKLKG